MKKYRTVLSGLKLFCLSGVVVSMLACSAGQDSDHQSPASGRTLPQPGMHVYKDPVTGEFLTQPPVEGKPKSYVLPQQDDDAAEPVSESESERAREYEAPGPGGGILLDLPAPYSETQE